MSPILQSLANGSARGYGAFFGAAAAPAYESIASATGTGSSGVISFTSIPSTYKHLQIRGIARQSTAGVGQGDIAIQFNSNTSAVYTLHAVQANGSSVVAFGSAPSTTIRLGDSIVPTSGNLSNTCGAIIIDIHDYASTSRYKTVRSFGGMDVNTTNINYLDLSSGLFMDTSAISSIQINSGANWTTQTQFALYGIKGA